MGHFLPEIPTFEGDLDLVKYLLLAYITTQVAVISGWISLAGSIGPRGHTKYVGLVVRVMVLARWVQNGCWRRSILVKKSSCLGGIQWRLNGLQCHPSGCNIRMEWIVCITNGTRGACQTSRFGDGDNDRSSMGPKQLLEGVIFDKKATSA